MDKNEYAVETFGSTLDLFGSQGQVLSIDAPLSKNFAGSLIVTIESLKQLPIDPYGGYGWFDAHGAARYGTWQAWVTKPQIMVKKPTTNDFYTWKEILSKDFVDAKLIHQILIQLNQLLKYVPPDRSVIVGDFKPGNILIDGDRVTGIRDWSEAGYGDFLYDVAYFDFWHEDFNFVQFADTHYRTTGNKIDNFYQRIDCHRLFIGLTALGVSAALERLDNYETIIMKMKKMNLIF